MCSCDTDVNCGSGTRFVACWVRANNHTNTIVKRKVTVLPIVRLRLPNLSLV